MSPVSLLYPELLLLIVPLVFLYIWRGRSSALGGFVRVVILVVLALLASVPLAPLGGKGADVMVVADLSRSMPADSSARALEIITLLEQRRRERRSRRDRDLRARGAHRASARGVRQRRRVRPGGGSRRQRSGRRDRPGREPDSSRSSRPSDRVVGRRGERRAGDGRGARSRGRGVPIDFRASAAGEAADIAVESLDVPGVVDEREPFQFTASVRTDRTVEAEAVLLRDDVEIAQDDANVSTRRHAADIPRRDRSRRRGALPPGARGTRRSRAREQSSAMGAVRVEAPATILLVNATGVPTT